MTFNRREFLTMAAVIGANAAWGRGSGSPSSVAWQERRDLYPEGVASGDPDSNSILLWTRRAPASLPVEELTVEIALDESFRKVIAKSTAKISYRLKTLLAGKDDKTSVIYDWLRAANLFFKVSRTKRYRPTVSCSIGVNTQFCI